MQRLQATAQPKLRQCSRQEMRLWSSFGRVALQAMSSWATSLAGGTASEPAVDGGFATGGCGREVEGDEGGCRSPSQRRVQRRMTKAAVWCHPATSERAETPELQP